MAYTCVRVVFEIGHVATVRNEPTDEGFTHDWELYLRGADNTEIHHFVEKVIFHLHESFPNHRRVVKKPPYVVYETGYAGFPLHIDVYLKNEHEPSKIRFNYHITLQNVQPKAPPLCNVKREKYVFKNPSENFRRMLIKGGGVGVGADSASGSHANHMSALNSDHSTDDHKGLNNKNKASPQDVSASSKKSKKENTPKNEEQLSANDPFSIFGQPIKTSKIPLVSKSSSKNQISDKQPLAQEKQSHSSKSSKHGSSSHKDKDKDKDRGGGGGGGVEKEKTKDKDKEKEKNSMKRSSKEGQSEASASLSSSTSSSKKDKFKDDKVRILKVSSKDDSKKNSYHEDKPSKEKSSSSSSAAIVERSDNSKEPAKFDKKDKESKKHKDEKKSKSKDKYKQNEKKENIDVVMKESYVNERSEKLFSNKDEGKEEKKFHRIVNDDVAVPKEKSDKVSSKDKSGAIAEAKNLFNNVNNNNSNSNNSTAVDSQIINNGDTQRSRDPEAKHKHHKHKKDKSKKDSKRDKEERKEKKESKENKERFCSTESSQPQQQQQPPPTPQQQQQQQQPQPPALQPASQPPVAAAAPQSRSTPKSTDSPRRLKKPVKALFEPDDSNTELSSLEDDPPPPTLPPAHHRLLPAKDAMSSPELNLIKEEPLSSYNKHDEQTKEEKYDPINVASTKKKKKTNEERENKKRKRKSKDKEENTSGNKMIKYENGEPEIASRQLELDRRPPKSVSPSETKFTDEYITKLKELQRKIMSLDDNSGLQRIVQVVAETGQYEITTKTFDFDLCSLDESIVQRLLDFFVP